MDILDRRTFLGRLGPGAAALALFPRTATATWRRPQAGRAAKDLPPQTIGLRSRGGTFVFDPPGLIVAPGERVTWLNMGDFHTVTAFHPDNAHLMGGELPLRMPEGAGAFHSGFLGLDAGSVFERAFELEGVYDYFCQPHYNFGMVGRLVVGAPRGGPALTHPVWHMPEAARKELPSIDSITGPGGRAYEWAARLNGVLLLATRDQPAGTAAEAVVEAAASENALGDLVGAGGLKRWRQRLDAFAEGVRGGVTYETLVQRADAAKDVLRS